MKMHLVRIAKQKDYTIGHLYVEGLYLCDTLEPTWRNLHREGKIWGRTAIPEGKYRVFITKSKKLGQWLPLIWQVPGFEGIRIHAGNYPKDTQGCILVGWNRHKGTLSNSRTALSNLMRLLTAALERGELIDLEIKS